MKELKYLFVSYETAVKLKEIGFNENCLYVYSRYKRLNNCGLRAVHWKKKYYTAAPIHQQAIDWFRCNYNLEVAIDSIDDAIELIKKIQEYEQQQNEGKKE